MKNKKILIFLIFSLVIIIFFIFFSLNYIEKESNSLLNTKYTLVTKQIHKQIKTLIDDKKNATLAFAIATSKFDFIKEALLSKNVNNLHLDNFSNLIKEETQFKNVWFQILDKNGTSVYRSWTESKGDSLLFRYDVQNILKEKNIQSTISVGRHDLTFKSMIPIFEDKKFLGIFEIITHFNSISKVLKESDLDVLIIANKRYYSKLTFPFSKKFIDKYYVSNLDASTDLMNKVKNFGVEKIINSENYLIIDDSYITKFSIDNEKNKDIGYIIVFKKLNTIDFSAIEAFKRNYFTYVIFTLLFAVIITAAIFYYIHLNNILIEKIRAQNIIDSQQNIIILTDGEYIKSVNEQFFKFFTNFKDLNHFKKHHKCVCEYFIDMKNDEYIINKDYNGKNWAEYTISNPNKHFKCAMLKDNDIEHFDIKINNYTLESDNTPYLIVTLTNITSDMRQKKELEDLNNNLERIVAMKTVELKNLNQMLEIRIEEEIKKSKEKDTILFQQNKMISMGEMITNIAHQWRQPLSAITTAASSILLKKEIEQLEDKDLDFYCNHILDSSKYLTNTIENFRSFFSKDEQYYEIKLNELFENIKILLSEKLKSEKIDLVINIDENFTIFTVKTIFQQAILNILNNSIDILINSNTPIKVIIIEVKENQLTILDSGKGIDEKIIDKIFEPYFTTKHQSLGTGIGLYMSHTILENNLNFKLSVKNENFTYKESNLYGAKFIIKF